MFQPICVFINTSNKLDYVIQQKFYCATHQAKELLRSLHRMNSFLLFWKQVLVVVNTSTVNNGKKILAEFVNKEKRLYRYGLY